ncbi:MAG: MBL fold metallo-hydrolase [Planctomycetes bacterium]|nr:MBL fold metallo-hydrolase [Planctomycetota bacterium]
MKLRLDPVLGNHQRLDGGAMFGNAPRALWATWAAPDDQNRIRLACRCLLIRERSRTILCETGIGSFFEPKLRERFGVEEGSHVLLENLAALGVPPEAIDVVVLSHLHFDHAGGALSAWREGQAAELVFPNARWVVGRAAFERATHPHARDRASFVPRLNELLAASARVEFVDGERSATLGPEYRLHPSFGHTPGMLLLEVSDDEGPLLFAADLIPGLPWVRRAITMGYDRFPELLIDEKTRLLDELVARGGRVFFTHDPDCAMARLARDEKGQVVALPVAV